MKNLVFIIVLLLVVSCSRSTDPTGDYIYITNSVEYFHIDYNGSWSGSVLSNDGLIYPISGFDDVTINGVDGVAIKKDDITGYVIGLGKYQIRAFDNGWVETNLLKRVESITEVVRIE